MDPTAHLQLPANTGYLSWSEIQDIYPKLAAAIIKNGVEKYYNYNPVTLQYDAKESRQEQLLKLTGMCLATVTLGNDPDANPTIAKKKLKTPIFFTDTKKLTPQAVLRDIPEKGESITVEEFAETYPKFAATFDGKDRDTRMDYFFKLHTKRTDDDNPIFLPVSKEKAAEFTEYLEEEINEQQEAVEKLNQLERVLESTDL